MRKPNSSPTSGLEGQEIPWRVLNVLLVAQTLWITKTRRLRPIKLGQIQELLDATFLTGEEHKELVVESAFGCDMMSDFLTFGKPGVVLLTGLTNVQVIHSAYIIDASAVVFVRGKRPLPSEKVLEMAAERGLPLLATDHLLYTSCGLLYKAGLPGCNS